MTITHDKRDRNWHLRNNVGVVDHAIAWWLHPKIEDGIADAWRSERIARRNLIAAEHGGGDLRHGAAQRMAGDVDRQLAGGRLFQLLHLLMDSAGTVRQFLECAVKSLVNAEILVSIGRVNQ